jgi:hypothetical protein
MDWGCCPRRGNQCTIRKKNEVIKEKKKREGERGRIYPYIRLSAYTLPLGG